MLIKDELSDYETTQYFINISGRMFAVLLNDKSANEPTDAYKA